MPHSHERHFIQSVCPRGISPAPFSPSQRLYLHGACRRRLHGISHWRFVALYAFFPIGHNVLLHHGACRRSLLQAPWLHWIQTSLSQQPEIVFSWNKRINWAYSFVGKKSRRIFALFKSTFFRNQSFSNARWFYSKKRKIWKRNLYFALMLITFSSPRAQPKVVYISWYQMKAHIFLIANPKLQLQILFSFGDITKSVKLNGIPENNFLCIFIIASSPGVHTFFCLWRVNKKLPQGETSQNAFQRSRPIN